MDQWILQDTSVYPGVYPRTPCYSLRYRKRNNSVIMNKSLKDAREYPNISSVLVRNPCKLGTKATLTVFISSGLNYDYDYYDRVHDICMYEPFRGNPTKQAKTCGRRRFGS